MAPDLYVKRAGQGAAVILLHGLFGAGANMDALARALQGEFAVFSVDLPNHGRSGCLHAEQPQLFNGIVARFLTSPEQRKLALTGIGSEG